MFYLRKAYCTHQYKNRLCHPYSYRITIDENPIPLLRICVFNYLCLLLTKVLFQTSFKSFQYNTEGRRLSNYSIKLILCSHYRSRCKGLCQNKKHDFYQYTKGGHFCAAHMALINRRPYKWGEQPSSHFPMSGFKVGNEMLSDKSRPGAPQLKMNEELIANQVCNDRNIFCVKKKV